MNNTSHKFRKNVAWVSIASGVVAFASFFFLAAGTAFHFEVFSEPDQLLGMNGADSQYLKWSMILDMFGYYLLLLPALFYFKNYLKKKTPWHAMIYWCGSGYIFLGAMGAAILSVVCPQLMVAYPIATAAEQTVMAGEFRLVMQLVHAGMWNTLEILLAGVWWLGIGSVTKKDRPAFGFMSQILGLSCLVDGVGTMLGWQSLSEIGLNIYLILAIVWPVWFGISLLRPRKFVQVGNKERKKILDTDHTYWSLVN